MISVVIPVYNRPRRLLRAVQSVLGQSEAAFELIVVDDGSTANLESVRETVEQAGHRFLRLEKNAGVAAARNAGAEAACGEWLALLDSDDRWLPGKLRKQLAYHRAHPHLRISQCREIWYRHGNRVTPDKKYRVKAGMIFERAARVCCISSTSVMMARDLFREAGGYDTRYPVCEDYALWLRITQREPVGLVPDPLAEKFGGHPDQLSRSVPVMDRFRLHALLDLLLEMGEKGDLVADVSDVLVPEIIAKAGILHQGTARRGLASASLYARIGVTAGNLRSEGLREQNLTSLRRAREALARLCFPN